MPQAFTESIVGEAALDWLAGLGWQTAFGPEIVDSERGGDFDQVEHLVLAVDGLASPAGKAFRRSTATASAAAQRMAPQHRAMVANMSVE